jgi:uncharacterized protein (UPF0548 family)
VFYLKRPSPAEIQAALAARRALPFSYPESGQSRTRAPADCPAGYPINHFRYRVGRGDALYARAVLAVRRWAMYDLPWTEVYPRGAPVEAGQVVVVLARHFGFWSLNPCRVVYVEQRGRGAVRHFSFALGTLPGHSERGEERFRVERRGDEVWFEVLAFAGPQHWLARLGYPLARRLQRRFARAAAAAVTRAAAPRRDAT